MESSTPFANIALTGAVIIVVLLIGGIVLVLADHTEQGSNLISIAIGTFAGTAATTGVVHSANGADKAPPP